MAPQGMTFDPSPFSLAVSPDGTHLAFIASSESGDNALWVRPLDSLTARKLADGASQPFWSADSRSLGFAGGGQLKKVELATGLVTSLAETLVVSGSWNRTGTLLVALPAAEQRRAGMLHTVADSGGPLTPVTELDPGRREIRHTNPFFLPDGRRFLYLARSDDPAYDGMLYVGSLDTFESVPLFQSRSRAVYTSGYLVFARGRTLLAQRFDPSTLRLEGAAAPIGDISAGPSAAFSVSDTGVLAYRSDQQTQLVWFDRSGRSLGPINEPGHYANPDLSPDGRQVAVSRRDPATGLSDVWIHDLERGTPARFTFDGARERVPLWSPDGSRLVYRKGPSLVVNAANGSGFEQPLADRLTNFDNPLDWSPDGRMLLLTSFDSSAATDMWLLPINGDHPRLPVTKSGSRWGVQARISPDGRWLAYASNETGRYEVYVRPFPSGDGRWLVTNAGGSEPSWRRDGTELYYLAADGWLMAVTVATAPVFMAGTPLRLFPTAMSTLVNTSFARNQYVVSRDGERFLLNQPIGEPGSIVVAVGWPAGLADRQ
jgi:Tol biopolymer transport system component